MRRTPAVAGWLGAAALVTTLAGCAPSQPAEHARATAAATTSGTGEVEHEPLLAAGAVNSTLHTVRVVGVADAEQITAAVPAATQARVTISPLAFTHGADAGDGWLVLLSAGTSRSDADAVAAALRARFGSAHVSQGTVVWGAVTLRAPLSPGSAYVRAIGADASAAASAATAARLNQVAPLGWALEVDRTRGELVLTVSASHALDDAALADLRGVFATESGALAASVRLVPGVPSAE